MSTPREQQLQEMFDRYLERTAGEPARTAALSLGVDSTYIAKLRGGWRPTRVREELWQRLVKEVGLRAGQVVREAAPAPFGAESRDFYRGKQETLMDVMRWVVDQQAQIGRYLSAISDQPGLPKDLSRAVEDLEAEAAVLDQLPSLPAPAPKKEKRRA